MELVAVNGVDLAVEQTGGGPAVVLVHGSWTDRHAWDLVTAGLGDRYRLITYDRRGHSQSERPPGSTGLAAHATDLAALIDHLEAGPAHIVANSFGGLVALATAAAHPGMVASLCLHEPPVFALVKSDHGWQGPLAAERRIERRVAALIDADDCEGAARTFIELVIGPGAWAQFPEEVHRTMVNNAPTVPGDFEAVHEPLDPSSLARIEVPVMLTGGGQSPAEVPFGAVLERLSDLLPTAEHHIFEAAGHAPHRTHPRELAHVVDAFVTRHVGANRPAMAPPARV